MVLVTWVLCGLSGWVQRELDPPRQLAALAGLVGAHGRRCSAPLLSVSVGRGQHGGGRSVSREPDRAGPSGRPGGAMWFMYVLSWLSLFIQVAFITLAVGESADLGRAPRCPELPTAAALCSWVRATPSWSGWTSAEPSGGDTWSPRRSLALGAMGCQLCLSPPAGTEKAPVCLTRLCASVQRPACKLSVLQVLIERLKLKVPGAEVNLMLCSQIQFLCSCPAKVLIVQTRMGSRVLWLLPDFLKSGEGW